MKSMRYVSLLALIGAGVGLGTFAIGQQTDVRPAIRPVRTNHQTLSAPTKPRAPQSGVEQFVKQNPTLLPYLLQEMNDSSDNDMQITVGGALAALAPSAVDELIKVIEGNDEKIKASAIGILTSTKIPASEIGRLIPVLLRIAQDENEEKNVQEKAKVAMCVLIHRAAPPEPAQPTPLQTY